MLNKIEKKSLIAFILLFPIFFITHGVHAAPIANDYVNNPITTTGGDKPNIAVFVDNSPSMRVPIGGMGTYYKDTDYSAFEPLNYGPSSNARVLFCTDDNAAGNYPCDNELPRANVDVDDVYKVIIYRDGRTGGSAIEEEPAFIRVCEDIDDITGVDACTIDGVIQNDTDGDGVSGPSTALYDALKGTTGTYISPSTGIVYYYGNYLKFRPPALNDVARAILVGETIVSAWSTKENYFTFVSNDVDGDDVISTSGIIQAFDGKTRFKAASFGTQGSNTTIQLTTSYDSAASSAVNNLKSKNVTSGVKSLLNEVALIGICDDYMNSEKPWKRGNKYTPCRKSFILMITDGIVEPTDTDPTPTATMNAKLDVADRITIGDLNRDLDNRETVGHVNEVDEPDWLDDTAKFFSETDIQTGVNLPGDQVVRTYTVGFGVAKRSDDGAGDVDSLLKDTATESGGTYYNASNPAQVASQIEVAINDMLTQAGSGTAVSVLATSGRGEGAAYQAIFLPLKQDEISGNNVDWMGFLQAYWVDSVGNLRQDDGTGNTGELVTSGASDDNIIQFIYNATDGTVVRVFDGTNDSCTSLDNGCISFENTTPIWEAGKMLAERVDLDPNVVVKPRNIYTFGGTHVFASCDTGPCSYSYYEGGFEIGGQIIPFDPTNPTIVHWLRPYLRAVDDVEAVKIMRYIRGEDDYPSIPYRNRTLDVDGTNRIWSLGDIVNSSPVAITAPTERYDKLYGDESYEVFYNEYKDRETVIYIGANDGMLHAFTGGKFDPVNLKFDYLVPNGSNEIPGTELWAYIPYDILPHLKWLTDPSYNHIYYVDLKPKITDAKIFPCNDGTHYGAPGDTKCWGTILIGGLRFGGGQIDVKDTAAWGAGGTRTFRSSFFALDITDPSKPPILLWRFTHPNLGFSTSRPAVIKVGENWFAVFGSGPDNSYDYNFAGPGGPATNSGLPDHNAEYDSSETGKNYSNIDTKSRVFIVDLRTGKHKKTFNLTTPEKTFMGDPIVVDIDFNKSETAPLAGTWNDEVVYIGETYKCDGAGCDTYPWDGKMWRIVLTDNATDNNDSATATDWELTEVYNPGLPLIAPPSSSMDKQGNPWLYFGTGRMYSLTDKENNPDGDQEFYGLKDMCWDGSKMLRSACPDTTSKTKIRNAKSPSGNIYNSTDVVVLNTGAVSNAGTITGFDALENEIRNNWDGWKIELEGAGERSLTKPGIVGGLVFATTVAIEGDNTCGQAGEGFLYSLYFGTGTAFKLSTIGEGSDTDLHAGFASNQVWKKQSLGTGAPAGVAVHIGEQEASHSGGTGGTVFIQDSTGKITQVNITTAFSLNNQIVNWQEVN